MPTNSRSMNRHSIANTVRISTVARTLFSAAAIAAATLPGLADAPSASKTYTLFMGDDISVGTGSEAYPVQDVSGSSWVVEVNRSEEHTSELQSLRHLVCRLLLEKKNSRQSTTKPHRHDLPGNHRPHAMHQP